MSEANKEALEVQKETRKDRACKFAAAHDLIIVPYCVAGRTTYSAKTVAGKVVATASGYDALSNRMQKYVQTKAPQLGDPVSKEDAKRLSEETREFDRTGRVRVVGVRPQLGAPYGEALPRGRAKGYEIVDIKTIYVPPEIALAQIHAYRDSLEAPASPFGVAWTQEWLRARPWRLSGATWESRHASRTEAVRALRRMVSDLAVRGRKLDPKHVTIERVHTPT